MHPQHECQNLDHGVDFIRIGLVSFTVLSALGHGVNYSNSGRYTCIKRLSHDSLYCTMTFTAEALDLTCRSHDGNIHVVEAMHSTVLCIKQPVM